MFAHKYLQKSISSIYFTAIFRNQTVIDVHLKLYQPLLSEKERASDDDDDGGKIYSARGVSIRECVRAWRLTSFYFQSEKVRKHRGKWKRHTRQAIIYSEKIIFIAHGRKQWETIIDTLYNFLLFLFSSSTLLSLMKNTKWFLLLCISWKIHFEFMEGLRS